MMSPKLSNRSIEIGSDYKHLCRLCLAKTSLKLNLFLEEGIRRDIQGLILNCLSLIVSEDDNLPKNVCHSCIDKLESFQDFRDLCHESENLLNAYVSSEEERRKQKALFENPAISWSSSPIRKRNPGIQETVTITPRNMGYSQPVFVKAEIQEETDVPSAWPQEQPHVKTEVKDDFVTPNIAMPSTSIDTRLSSQCIQGASVLPDSSRAGSASDPSQMLFDGMSATQSVPSGQNVPGSEGYYPYDGGQFGETVSAEDSDDEVLILSDDDDTGNSGGANLVPSGSQATAAGERFSTVLGESCSYQIQPGNFSPCKTSNISKSHVKLVRNERGEKRFACTLCHKLCTDRSNCAKHTKMHSVKRPIKCSICNRSFTSKYNLKKHLPHHLKTHPWCFV